MAVSECQAIRPYFGNLGGMFGRARAFTRLHMSSGRHYFLEQAQYHRPHEPQIRH